MTWLKADGTKYLDIHDCKGRVIYKSMTLLSTTGYILLSLMVQWEFETTWLKQFYYLDD